MVHHYGGARRSVEVAGYGLPSARSGCHLCRQQVHHQSLEWLASNIS
jgi:hypothetical protein